jgi:eukaryotic-like serine/threonine-protein kinase
MTAPGGEADDERTRFVGGLPAMPWGKAERVDRTRYAPSPDRGDQGPLAASSAPPSGASRSPTANASPGLRWWVLSGVLVLALTLAGIAILQWSTITDPPAPASPGSGRAALPPRQDTLPPAERARRIVDSALPSVYCSWLSMTGAQARAQAVSIGFTGVSGDPAQSQAEIARSLRAAGIANANLDFEDVAPVTQAGCAVLDTYRQVRDPQGAQISVPQRQFEMRMQPEGTPYAGTMAANAIVDLDAGPPDRDLALIGFEPSGLFTMLVTDKAMLKRLIEERAALIEEMPDGTYRMRIDLDHAGWSGLILVTGKAPFPEAVVTPPVGQRGPDWREAFLAAAIANDWRAQMVWFKSVE